jgi:hypothetical protein
MIEELRFVGVRCLEMQNGCLLEGVVILSLEEGELKLGEWKCKLVIDGVALL